MLTVKQLQTWFADTGKIISDISSSMRNLKRITGVRDTGEQSVLEDPFFAYFRKQLVFTIVVQLCKLYVDKDTERRNTRKLFNRLKYDKYSKRLKQRIRENRDREGMLSRKADVIRLVDGLIPELESRTEQIHRLRSLRDRIYAHSDPGHTVPELTVDELDDLVQLAEKIFNETSGRLLGEEFTIEPEANWEIEPIIKALVKGRRTDTTGQNK